VFPAWCLQIHPGQQACVPCLQHPSASSSPEGLVTAVTITFGLKPRGRHRLTEQQGTRGTSELAGRGPEALAAGSVKAAPDTFSIGVKNYLKMCLPGGAGKGVGLGGVGTETAERQISTRRVGKRRLWLACWG